MTNEQIAALCVQQDFIIKHASNMSLTISDLLDGCRPLEDTVMLLRQENSRLSSLICEINMAKIRMEELWKLQQSNSTTQLEDCGMQEQTTKPKRKSAQKLLKPQKKQKKKS